MARDEDVKDDFTYETSKVEGFFVPEGTAIEVYATTLHYAPCGVDGQGFKCVVVLPKGTNLDVVILMQQQKISCLRHLING